MAVEAAAVLAFASVAVRVLPGGRVTSLLGTVLTTEPPPPAAAGGDARARGVGRMVERVAARLPWQPKCLPQAIATRAMLRRRGIACESHLGIVSTRPLAAHAWVTVGGAVVQGGPVTATELAAFS